MAYEERNWNFIKEEFTSQERAKLFCDALHTNDFEYALLCANNFDLEKTLTLINDNQVLDRFIIDYLYSNNFVEIPKEY